MEKKKIREMIIYHSKNGVYPYKWKDIKEILQKKNVELQDEDEVVISFEEGYQEGDVARDDSYTFQVHRTRDETDEELEKRIKRIEENKKQSKELRFKSYIKLKAEFEPEKMLKNKEFDPYGEEIWENYESGD